MPELKTRETDSSVEKFLDSIKDERKRNDSYKLVKLIKQITRHDAKMWGTSIVGFGSFHYKYESGHEGDSCLVGFSPRKGSITLYLFGGFHRHKALMKKLGKHKTGVGCLYINTLEDVDIDVLREVIEVSLDAIKRINEARKEKKKWKYLLRPSQRDRRSTRSLHSLAQGEQRSYLLSLFSYFLLLPAPYIPFTIASPNSEHFTSFAPSIRRAKS